MMELWLLIVSTSVALYWFSEIVSARHSALVDGRQNSDEIDWQDFLKYTIGAVGYDRIFC